jgi:hypothetical protein
MEIGILENGVIIRTEEIALSGFAHAGKLWVSQHMFAGLALKKTVSIPQDFAAWNYWPTRHRCRIAGRRRQRRFRLSR